MDGDDIYRIKLRSAWMISCIIYNILSEYRNQDIVYLFLHKNILYTLYYINSALKWYISKNDSQTFFFTLYSHYKD